jgi:hypothetical protein
MSTSAARFFDLEAGASDASNSQPELKNSDDEDFIDNSDQDLPQDQAWYANACRAMAVDSDDVDRALDSRDVGNCLDSDDASSDLDPGGGAASDDDALEVEGGGDEGAASDDDTLEELQDEVNELETESIDADSATELPTSKRPRTSKPSPVVQRMRARVKSKRDKLSEDDDGERQPSQNTAAVRQRRHRLRKSAGEVFVAPPPSQTKSAITRRKKRAKQNEPSHTPATIARPIQRQRKTSAKNGAQLPPVHCTRFSRNIHKPKLRFTAFVSSWRTGLAFENVDSPA